MIHTFIQNNFISIFITIAIVVFLIYRQIRPRKLGRRSLILFPLIILYFLIQSLPSFHPTHTKIMEIILSSTVSTILGLLACRQLHVYEGSNGKAMAKGSWTYFLWWLGAFIIKSCISIMFGETSLSRVSQLEILIPVFILVTTRNAYLYWKVYKLKLKLH